MSEKNLYRNSLTGMVEHLTEEQAAVFPRTLEQVPEGTKPLLPGMFKPGLLGEDAELPEPVTADVEAAQAEYDAVIEDNAPQSKVAREARERLEAAKAEAEKAAAEIKE